MQIVWLVARSGTQRALTANHQPACPNVIQLKQKQCLKIQVETEILVVQEADENANQVTGTFSPLAKVPLPVLRKYSQASKPEEDEFGG